MIKNTADKSFVSERINGDKWLLLCCSALAAAVDIAIIAMLAIGGIGGGYLACPIILLIFDLIYIAVSLFFTNFRFKYSLLVWISYVVLFTIGLFVGAICIMGGEGTVITGLAAGLWIGVHVFAVVCAIFSALYASRIFKNKIFIFILAAVFLIGCALYSAFVITNGFFGQGVYGRTVVYEYNKNADAYAAVDVLSGRSGNADIPETFNGKRVDSVHCQLFTRPNLTSVNLSGDLEIIGEEALNDDVDFSGLQINVDKKYVNKFRKAMFTIGNVQGNEALTTSAVALANATVPFNLEKGEGYVSFAYDADNIDIFGGKEIPVFVGDLSTFDLKEHIKDYDYAAHIDDGSVENYDWAYKNGGYILSEIVELDGAVSKNTVAELSFDKVYRISFDGSNDTKYDIREKQPELCYDSLNGSKLNYRYVTAGVANEIIGGVTPRKGFTYNWYSVSPQRDNLTDLGGLLKEIDGNTLKVGVRWQLKAPEVSVRTSANGVVTYGDNLTLYADAQVEAEGVSLNYRWEQVGESYAKWSGEEVNLTNPKPSQYNGGYKVHVSVDGGEVTSLSSSASCEFEIAIRKKEIPLIWDLPQDRVYNGENKVASVSFDQSLLIGGDELNVDITGGVAGTYAMKDARTYFLSCWVYGNDANEYSVKNASVAYTVTPRPVEVVWGVTEFTYSASVQSPAASATGVASDGEVVTGVRGGQINAGTHTANAYTDNTNYTLTNNTHVYNIAKRALKIKADDVVKAYGKSEPKTVIVTNGQCDGFVGSDSVNSLSGTAWMRYEGKDFGEYPEGVIIWGLSSGNYDIQFIPGQLTVGKRTIKLQWSGTEGLVYDGTPKNVTAAVTEKGYEDDDIKIRVVGGDATAAGEHEATVVIDENCADANNYGLTFTANKKINYTIQKAKVKITPDDKTSVYGEPLVELTAKVEGEIYNNEIEYALEKYYGNNAGTHTIIVNITKGEDDGNYDISTRFATYTITKKVAYVKWNTESQRTFYYDGNEHSVFTDIPQVYVGFTENDLKFNVQVTNYSATDAGKYTARLVVDSEVAGNYLLAQTECEWEIKKAPVLAAIYINGVFQSAGNIEGEAFKVEVGNVLTWKFTTVNGDNTHPINWAKVTKEDVDEIITDEKYEFKSAGVYTVTINFGDDNHETGLKTFTVNVSENGESQVYPEVTE